MQIGSGPGKPTPIRVAAPTRPPKITRACLNQETPATIDRIAVLPQSVCCKLRQTRNLKKIALIVALVILAPILVMSLSLLAAGEWQTIGQTKGGDTVSISSLRVLKRNQRVALIRVDYKEPPAIAGGGPFLEMRARVHFNCSAGTAVSTTEWFYTRDRSGRFVVGKKVFHAGQFGNAPEGGFANLVSQSVCGQGK